MTLFEYLEIRNGLDHKKRIKKVLSRKEGILFGLDIKKKGWADIDFELDSNKIGPAVSHVMKSETVKSRIKTQLASILKVKNVLSDKKLYLLQNSNGLFKIGISVDPYKRARTLANASGYQIDVIAMWEMLDSYGQEQNLHKIFKRYRKAGEWFDKTDLTPQEIEENLSCEFKRVYLFH